MEKRLLNRARARAAVFLAAAMLLSGCGAMVLKVRAEDLTRDIKSKAADKSAPDARFLGPAFDFVANLFSASAMEDKNAMISPASVLFALAMCANGAGGETLAQMEQVLAGGMGMEDLNRYLAGYSDLLTSTKKTKLNLANSIWFMDDGERLTVEKDFLQKNADYYSAAAYRAPFDETTLNDINEWVRHGTDGMIEKMLDKIPKEELLFIINAVAFDGQWKKAFDKARTAPKIFYGKNGDKTADFMHSAEEIALFADDAAGFIKPYHGDKFSFVALLPDDGVSVDDYIASLTGEKLKKILDSSGNGGKADVAIPKFSFEFDILLNDALSGLGMTDAFLETADFSGMGSAGGRGLLISRVLHKTFIEFDESGTKAAAATVVGMMPTSMAPQEKLVFDRPFVFAIVENTTALPVFIGALMDAGE